MKIHQLQKSRGLKDKARRRGRGNGTGTGNYSGRGLKGQKSRSGHSMKPFFEGGQTSIVQRLPKARGFTRYYKLVKDVVIVNLGMLDADTRITDAMEITKQLLKDLGYIKSATAFVKILGHGDYAKHLTFKDIDAFSASAKTKMENPGTVHSVAKKTPVKGEKPVKKEPIKKEIKKAEPVKKEIKKVEPMKKEAKKVEPTKKAEPVKKIEPVKKEVKKVEKVEAPKKVSPKVEKPVNKPVAKKEPVKATKPAAKKPATKKTK